MATTIGNASIAYVDTQISTKISGFLGTDSGKITTDGSGGLTVTNLTVSGNISGNLNPKKFIIPTKTVSTLDSSATVGEFVFVSDALKPGEVTGTGTGVTCYYDGKNWINSAAGTTVVA